MSCGSMPVQKLSGSSFSITDVGVARKSARLDLADVEVEGGLGAAGVATAQDGHRVPAPHQPLEVGRAACPPPGRAGRGCRRS